MPELTDAQREFLLCGPKDAYDPAFEDEAQVLAAWAEHGADLLAACQGSGRRRGQVRLSPPAMTR